MIYFSVITVFVYFSVFMLDRIFNDSMRPHIVHICVRDYLYCFLRLQFMTSNFGYFLWNLLSPTRSIINCGNIVLIRSCCRDICTE